MKKTWKRLIALILAMAMCLSLLSANVWAAEEQTDASVSSQSSEESSPDEEVPTEDEMMPAEEEESAPEEETPAEDGSGQEEVPQEDAVPEEEPPQEEEVTPAEESAPEEISGENEPAPDKEQAVPEQEPQKEQEQTAQDGDNVEEQTDVAVTPQEIVASGICGNNGDNLTWTLDDEGTLTISGNGVMDNYASLEQPAPWKDNRNKITNVVIKPELFTAAQSCTKI